MEAVFRDRGREGGQDTCADPTDLHSDEDLDEVDVFLRLPWQVILFTFIIRDVFSWMIKKGPTLEEARNKKQSLLRSCRPPRARLHTRKEYLRSS